MSYSDITYLNMPSFWTEFFSDKYILDALYETSMDIVSSSYGSMLKEFSNQSIYNQDTYTKEDWYSIRCEKSLATVITVGEDTYEIFPVDTPVVDFMFISSKPDLGKAVTVYSKDAVRLVNYFNDAEALLKNIGLDIRLVGKPKLLIAKNSYLLSSAEFSDGLDSYYEVDKNCSIHMVGSFRYTQLYSDIVNSPTLIEVSVGAAIYKVLATRAEHVNGTTTIYIDVRTPIPSSPSVFIKYLNKSYKGNLVSSSVSEVALNVWCRKTSNEYKSNYFKFGFPLSESELSSNGNSLDVIKSMRELTLTGPTIPNIKRCLATLQGSRLLTHGSDNNEVIISVDLDTGRIVTSTNCYDHSRPFSINKGIIKKAEYLAFNGYRLSHHLYLLEVNYDIYGYTITSKITSLFSEQNIISVNSLGQPIYDKVVSINGSSASDIIYLGRDYVIIQSLSEIHNVASLTIKARSSGSEIYTFDPSVVIKLSTLNSPNSNTDINIFGTTTLSQIDISNSFSASSVIYEGLYIPSYLYNTTPARRKISQDKYDAKVGEMPIHVVGDYGLFVSDTNTEYASSAYYIFKDFLYHNTALFSYGSYDIDLGLIPSNIDYLVKRYGSLGVVPLHKQYNSLISQIPTLPIDRLALESRSDFTDSLTSLVASETSIVQDDPYYRKYLHLYFNQEVAISLSYTLLIDGLEVEAVYMDVRGTIVEVMLVEESTTLDPSKFSLNGQIPDEIVPLLSVGSPNVLLGAWQPLVGSGLPILSKRANSILNKGKLSDVGPSITIT